MEEHGNVAIFWDLDNCRPGANITGYEAVENIRSMAQTFGSVRLFKAYLDVSQQVSSSLRTELQASGVSLIDCPPTGRKSVADKMLIVDMITHIIDNPAPATLVLISGDRDYAYAVSTLRLRRYRVVVICPPRTHISLTTQASVHLDWDSEVLGEVPLDDLPPPTLSNHQPITPSRKRADSTVSRTYTPSASKSRYPLNQDDEDEDLYLPYDTYRSASTRVNGPDDFAPTRYPYPSDLQSGRQASVAPSRAYTFQSAKSSPPTPPLAYKTPEPTFGSNGGGFYGRSFTPNLPKGFPFSEPEPISLKSPEAGPSSNNAFHRSSTFDTGVQRPSEPFTTTAPLRPRSTSLFGVFTPASTTTAPLNPVPLPFGSVSSPAPPPALATASTSSAPAKPPQPTAPVLAPNRVSTPTPTTAQTSTVAPVSEKKSAPVRVPTPPPLPPAPVSDPIPAPTPAPTVPAPTATPTHAPASNPTPKPAPAPKTTPAPTTTRPATSATAATSGSSAFAPLNLNPVPAHFQPLVTRLQIRQKAEKQPHIRFSDIGVDLSKHDGLYARAGVSKFGKYIALAVKAGIVESGGFGNDQWISLCPGYA
ncbi:NYN domain-containing protein [Collybia nuda]|uniref:NYN domain-containing protein n=1 Tax=Collybia nuda TaxID=64659 RepID=A0A9P5YCY6_9AGAR|nr:NYN domain-containing protein [Collybia nuda]